MSQSSTLHDFKVDKPKIIGESLSDWYIVYTTDGLVLAAQYGSDGYWHGEADETFGNVTHWIDGFPVPANFRFAYARYGGEI